MNIAKSQEAHKGGSLVHLAEQLQDMVREAAEQAKPLHEVERRIWDQLLEIGHASVEQLIALQGDGDLGETVVTVAGNTLKRSAEPVERPLRTVFGEHTIRAYVYAPGPKDRIELRPVDARLSLPAGSCSYLFEEFSQFFCVEQAFGQAAQAIHKVLHQTVSVDTLEHINRRMGEQAAEFLDQLPTPTPAQEGELLVLTADCKGVPLVCDDAARLPVFAKPERPGNRRMAALAGVYSVDRFPRTPEEIVAALFRDPTGRPARRPRPQSKHVVARFGRRYEQDGETIESSGPVEAMIWASQQVRDRRGPGQVLIRLMDAQASLWEAADLCLDLAAQEKRDILMVDILDILHVSSYVWQAAKAFYPHWEHQEAFARERLLRILQGDLRSVIAGMRQMASKRTLSRTARKQIRTVCGYFEHNIERMQYDLYLREGYPIATGVIEGACRHLVKDRMERSGMRWRLEGAQAMLEVRAVYQSSYWDGFHERRIKQEQPKLHPHGKLLCGYTPKPLAL